MNLPAELMFSSTLNISLSPKEQVLKLEAAALKDYGVWTDRENSACLCNLSRAFRPMSRTTAYVVDLPKTQDATRIPEEWNARWEKHCAQNAFPPEVCLARAMSAAISGIFDQYSALLQTTCENHPVLLQVSKHLDNQVLCLADESKRGNVR